MRLFNKLVGRAVGNMVSFGEAWNKTKGTGAFYFGLVLYMIVLTFLTSLVFGFLSGLIMAPIGSPALFSIMAIVFTALFVLFEIYLYAAFYAICVEVYQKFFGNNASAA